MRTRGFALVGALLLALVSVSAPSSTTEQAAVQVVADPTPQPTLPNPYPTGAPDPDAQDYGGSWLIVGGMAVVAILVAGGSVLVARSIRKDETLRR